MKYIKKFNESDSWAGSLYAYGYLDRTGFNQKINNQETILPLKSTVNYKCDICEVEFYVIDGDNIICPVCKNEIIKESYNNQQEYINDIINQFKKYNIRPVVLNKLLDFYSDEIKDAYENDKPTKDFVDSKVEEMELDDFNGNIKNNMCSYYSKSIKYL